MTTAPFPLSDATDILGDLVTVALLAGPHAFLQAASWLVVDILGTHLHNEGHCAHAAPHCPATQESR